MIKAYEKMEGTELPNETIGSFFKDWGKMAAADDLCVLPSSEEAAIVLSNAREYLPHDQEIPVLQKSIVDRGKNIAIDLLKLNPAQNDEINLILQRKTAGSSKNGRTRPQTTRRTGPPRAWPRPETPRAIRL